MIDPGENDRGGGDGPAFRVLVLLPCPEAATAGLAAARAAMAALGLAPDRPVRLTGATIRFDAARSGISAEEVDLELLSAVAAGTGGAEASAARAAFQMRAAEIGADWSGSQFGWRDAEGDADEQVRALSADADLIVVGLHRTDLDFSEAMRTVLFDLRRPVLAVPADFAIGRPLGRHMAIGWRSGAALERAIAAARPWLDRAERVSILTVEPGGLLARLDDAIGHEAGSPGATEAVTLRAQLAASGVAATFLNLKADERGVGDRLLAGAAEIGADCLVMGAYEHWPLWEAIFGGVTRDVVQHTPIPVFLAH